MSIANKVLAINNNLPIRTNKPVHNGKVRSVYWLTESDSKRIIEQHNYDIAVNAPLAVMIISDRISAFDCIWHGTNGLKGVPGKGAALNAISSYWFQLFRQHGLANNHIVAMPHPLVWIVQKAKPIMIEAIGRRYITGSMWRAYAKGERNFCGIDLPNNLHRDQLLPELLITPSTKGITRGVFGVAEQDDSPIDRAIIEQNFQAFKFNSVADIAVCERLLIQGFELIEQTLAKAGQLFVDTKFEFGYVANRQGQHELIYIDEVGTPDSSRIWDGVAYCQGKILEKSKEFFRQYLLGHVSNSDVLLNADFMAARQQLAKEIKLPEQLMLEVADTYLCLAEQITGAKIQVPEQPKQEITTILQEQYQLIN